MGVHSTHARRYRKSLAPRKPPHTKFLPRVGLVNQTKHPGHRVALLIDDQENSSDDDR